MITKYEYVKKLWHDNAVLIQKEPITLKSNRKSCVYINHRNFICLPDNFKIIISLLSSIINDRISKKYAFCNVTSTLSPILIAGLSINMNIPFYFYRPVSSEKGLVEDIFSYEINPSSIYPNKLPAILIDDVVTTTNTIRMTAQSLHFAKYKVLGCFCLVDRRIKSEKRDLPFMLKSVATLEEILKIGLKEIKLEDEQKNIIEIELEILNR